MDKTREEFVTFVRQAVSDSKSQAYHGLYQFLVSCFVRADTGKEGRLRRDMFDNLIEEAAELPRKYGFAPKSEILFPSVALRKSGRNSMFNEMDTDSTGFITLKQWVKWAMAHIAKKVSSLPKDYLGGTSPDVSKEEFIGFIKRAVNKGSPEYRELYFFLLKTFQRGDVDRKGTVNPVAFDLMIEDAASAPRRFGLAPKSSELYRSNRERLDKRKENFRAMDTNVNGEISFNEWLNYAMRHIQSKVSTL